MTDDGFPHDLDCTAEDPEPPKPARLNRRLVIAGALVLAGTIALALQLGFETPRPAISATSAPDAEPPDLLKGDVLNEAPNVNYSDLTNRLEPPPASPPEPPATAPMAVQNAVLPSRAAVVTTSEPVNSEAAVRLRQLAQEAEDARRSGLFFAGQQANAPRTPPPARTGPYAVVGRQDGQNIATAELPDAGQNLQSNKESFAASQGPSGAYLDKPYLEPFSHYEVKAGTVIPGALVTGLNSDLPGQIIGRITQNVYDSTTGNFLLIPQGTMVIGRYNSFVAYGQERAQIVWDRLVMPDGRSIELDTMSGVDQGGYSGLEDEVDHHWGRIAGGIILSTGISVLANLATNRDDRSSIYYDVGDAAAQEAARVGAQFTRRNLNVQPTLKVRPGWPFNIIVHKDMILAPYW